MTVPGWGSWSFEPVPIIVLAAASLVYARVYRRAARTAPKPPGAGHWIPYYSGIAAIAIALLSPVDAIGDSYLLSVHMIQHVLLSDIAPALIILGLRAPVLPLGLSKRALRSVAPGSTTGRWLARVTSPWVAVPVWVTVTWVWAIPSVFDFTAQHQLLHDFEHLTLFYAGLALWWLIIDPLPRHRLRSNGSRLALLGLTRVASAFVCVPLTWLTQTEYPLYAAAPRAYGISAINDQHIAGAAMCFIEVLVFGIAFVVVFLSMLGRDEARTVLAEEAASGRHTVGHA